MYVSKEVTLKQVHAYMDEEFSGGIVQVHEGQLQNCTIIGAGAQDQCMWLHTVGTIYTRTPAHVCMPWISSRAQYSTYLPTKVVKIGVTVGVTVGD